MNNLASSAPAELPAVLSCRICGNADENTPYRVREMQYGTRETFDYFQCRACGCLQIARIPSDLGRHYAEDYVTSRPSQPENSFLRSFVDPRRVRHGLGYTDIVGWMANKVSRPLDYVTWLRRAGLLDTKIRILDVGCGNGRMLLRMKLGGFAHCTGVDPFIRDTLRYPNGVTIHKTNLDAFSASAGPFDLIMFHHALEHMSDPLKALRIAARLLSENGCVLASVPVADSLAWEQYREDWCNLDAPRHLHVMTKASMAHLAGKSGLTLEYVVSESTIAQFTQSERYKHDVPGNAPLRSTDLPNPRRMKEFRRMTERLNREGRGDRAMFYLRKKAD